jgi:proteasome lid subunit RPN8/RPN11
MTMDLVRHPWARDGVRVPRRVLAEIEQHACEAYGAGLVKEGLPEGEEACGVLDGPTNDALLADRATRIPNLANRYHDLDRESFPRSGRTYFLIDPLRFSKLVRGSEADGRPVKVLYHSHLDCGAYFSETDAQTALAGGEEPSYDLAFLVVSVRGDGCGGGAKVDDRKLFVWEPETRKFIEAPLVVEP